MKNITLYLASIAFIAISLGSCKKDFLERQPQTAIGTENFFNSEQDLKLYINNLYNFPGWGIYNADRATDNAATTGAVEIKTMMPGSN